MEFLTISPNDRLSDSIVELLLRRRRQCSQPMQRDDGRRVALAVEGGGMYGVVAAGMVSALEELDLLHAFDDIYGTSAGAIRQREAVAARGALERQHEQAAAEYEKTILGDLAKAEQQASQSAHDLAKAEQRLQLQTLRAPIDGTVQQLAVHTVGGVVTPAQALLVVAPDDPGLIVEAQVENGDVGFVHPGQPVEVKVETFTFTRYGLLHGRVVDVSRDSVSDNASQPRRQSEDDKDTDKTGSAAKVKSPAYIAHVVLDRTSFLIEGHEETLASGMSVTAEIKTGRRTVMSYLMSPLRRYAHDGIRER